MKKTWTQKTLYNRNKSYNQSTCSRFNSGVFKTANLNAEDEVKNINILKSENMEDTLFTQDDEPLSNLDLIQQKQNNSKASLSKEGDKWNGSLGSKSLFLTQLLEYSKPFEDILKNYRAKDSNSKSL